MVIIGVVTAFLFTALPATAKSKGRSVEARIAWLQERVKVHQFGCKHQAIKNSHWHCLAKKWTMRELQEARKERWRKDYDWQHWLPAKWYRIARCETHLSWNWDSGTYVSAFGIYRPAYQQFANRTLTTQWGPLIPTPREQLAVALAIYQSYGYGAWGCGGA